MALLKLDNVTKEFDGVRAVNGISFEIDRGEVVGFLGPNGAGKSTTMRMITQYLDPDEGEIQVDGHTLPGDSLAAKRRIGYLPENNPLYTDMIVADYLEFIARLRGLELAEARSGIAEAVAATGIQGVYYRPIDELSKGFRQRVGLAQAILHRPDLLVLDEPTEGLDPSQRVEIRKLIAALGRERTVMLSTHVLAEVQNTASRILIINEGVIAADGRAEDLVGRGNGMSQVVVELDGTNVLEGLRGLDGVRDVAETPGADGRTCATLTADAGRDLRPDVFRAAVQHHWTLYELRRETQSLEEIFLQLTQAGGEGGAE